LTPPAKAGHDRAGEGRPLTLPARGPIPSRPTRRIRNMALDVTAEEKPTNVAGERLRSIVDRIERLEEERKALGSDIKDIYSEAKSAGFDIKVLRQLIRIRKQEPAEIEEQETLLDVYRRAIGM
jgi:uncharacterized protein (UPF0335 family)